jgi:hypothetical protein
MERETDESTHFRYMKFYMDWAIAHGVPLGILSCGFQFAPGQNPSCAAALTPWAPYLTKALFVTLRSPTCVRVASELTGRSDCHFFPDAAYLLRPGNLPPPSDRKRLVVIPAGAVNARDPFIKHFIKLFDPRHFDQVWVSMGAMVDDAPLLADTCRAYPHARVIENPSPEEALAWIAGADFVMTGRYHGLIFARVSGVPYYAPQDSPYKILSEDLSADPTRAAGHFEVLQSALASL